MAAVIFCYVSRAQIVQVDFFYETERGISVINSPAYIIYYGIIILVLLPALLGGKRAFCHYFCWMAPFMVIGTKLRESGLCRYQRDGRPDRELRQFQRDLPMSIDVSNAVNANGIDSAECIQCGACVDDCPKKALAYSMRRKG